MDRYLRYRRLLYVASSLVVYVISLMVILWGLQQNLTSRVSYSAAIATLPDRVHAGMNDYEVRSLQNTLSKLNTGGDLSELGLQQRAPRLDTVIGKSRFDLDATLALLSDRRFDSAKAKVELMSANVQRAQARRMRYLSILPGLAIFGAIILLLLLISSWWKIRTKTIDEITVIEDDYYEEEASISFARPFTEHMRDVVDEEVEFTGHAAKLKFRGKKFNQFPGEYIDVMEKTIEQFVRNSIEHGGRPPDVRLMAGKSEHLNIEVRYSETPKDYEVSVLDDGEGLDEKQVARRAVDLGLVSREDVVKMHKKRAIKFIFMRGFHSEQRLLAVPEDDLSLHELRALVRRSGGSISLQSSPGNLCRFSARFPKIASEN